MLERTLGDAEIAFGGTTKLKSRDTIDVGMAESLRLSTAA